MPHPEDHTQGHAETHATCRWSGSTGRLVPGVVYAATDEAERIRADARRMLDGARAEAEGLGADARRAGFEAGRAEGREAGLANVTEVLVAARRDADALRVQATQGALALARRMAEKILGRALDADPGLVAGVAEEALAAARARAGAVVLRAHPDDVAAVERSRPRLAARIGAAVEIRTIADASVGRGGCIVETPAGRLDARLDAQLDALEKALGGGS